MSGREYVHELPRHQAHGLHRAARFSERWHIDGWLLLLLLTLTAYGLLVLYSGSGRSLAVVQRQGLFFLVGYTAMLLAAQLQPATLMRLTPWAYAAGIVLLLLVPVIGVESKGARRWLDLPGLPQFQPSEIMKLMVPLCVSWYLGRRALPPRFVHVLASLALIAVPVILVLRQPDLGTSLLVLTAGLFALWLAGLSWWYVGTAGLLLLVSTPVVWLYLLHDYQKQRVLTLLNPEADVLGAGWNIIQSKTAIGSGGWQGKGWLQGTQSHLDFLPESHTDFIIAVLAEEFGLVGVLALLALYLLLILRGLHIALQAQDMFSRLLAGSLTLTFFVYVFVNMSMVSGMLPVVGVPLPLVSQGGTSLVTLLLGFGLLMAVATSRRRLLGN